MTLFNAIGTAFLTLVIVCAWGFCYLIAMRHARAEDEHRIQQAERDVADAKRKRFERKLGWKDAA